ncbi:glycoside hydrolase family 127 protein [Planosporangium sp. 12N6]|uniref:glycoside hydrolase family 127 protein n=1 Tax=Planosporangium spinosum TaxID=3402278 RepID=UPI003CF03592
MANSHPGPVAPTPSAVAALRPLPLDAVRLDPAGLLGAWQERNATATVPHCVAQVEAHGPLDNVRRVVGESTRDFRGLFFADSDIYKTAEAVAWQLAGARADAGLREWLDATTALLGKAQDEDGYLDSYFMVDRPEQRWRELPWSHELYCAGHLIQAAVAAERAGVGSELMPIARRFADLVVDVFAHTDGVCGHPEIETALVELYRTTGHRPYLEQARRFVDLRGHGLLGADRFGPGYFQDHVPVRQAREVTGHAVRQLYLLAGMVDVAVETHDTPLLDAATRLWDDAFSRKTYVTGGHGSRHRDEAFGDPHELPPDRAYAETCAAIASFQWNWRMLLATGRHRYADEMERTLHNAVAGAISADGRHFFYSNPLQLRTGHDGSDEDAPAQRLAWYRCPCCPPNLARLMASLHGYVATADDDGVQLHLYGAGTIRAGDLDVEVRTGYPWHGRIEVTVRAGTARPRTLALRVPGWCAEYRVEVDGVAVAAAAEAGYVRLTRDWSRPTVVRLDLAMPPRLVVAHPRVDAVRGCVALARGPLVYCVEQADLPDGVDVEDVRLDVDGPVTVRDDGDRVVLTTSGAVVGPVVELYRDHPLTGGVSRPLTITSVPYFLWGNRGPGAMRVWVPVAG